MRRHAKRSAKPSLRLRKSAQRLLTSLAERGAVPQAGDDAAALIAADLATQCPDGCLQITDAGRSHLLRQEYARTSSLDPFLGQHVPVARQEIETAQGRTQVAMDAGESPLVWLARRKSRDGRVLIEPEQLQAGERLRTDVTYAQMMPRVTSNWTSVVSTDRRGGSALTYSDTAVAAHQRVRRALESVGPEFSGLLLDVCCFLKGLEDVERERGWPARSAKVVLQLGLDRLARHYGYAAEAHGAAHAHVRTWLAPGASFIPE